VPYAGCVPARAAIILGEYVSGAVLCECAVCSKALTAAKPRQACVPCVNRQRTGSRRWARRALAKAKPGERRSGQRLMFGPNA